MSDMTKSSVAITDAAVVTDDILICGSRPLSIRLAKSTRAAARAHGTGGDIMSMTSTILAVLLALIFVTLGTTKVLALPVMRERAREVGFTVGAYRRIGALEVAGAIGLLIGIVQPLIGGLAGAGLLLLLGGALVAHLRKGDGPQKFAPAVICGLLVAVYFIVHFGAAR
jgi:hypothetical protein